MAVKYMPTFGNQNEYFQAVAESADIYNKEDYLKLSDEYKTDYNKLMSIYAQEGSSKLNKDLYNTLYDPEDKFKYLVSTMFSTDEELAENMKYFNQKAVESEYQRAYDSLSNAEKVANTIGGVFAHIGNAALDFVEGLGDAALLVGGTIVGGGAMLRGDQDRAQSIFDWTMQAVKDNELQDISKWLGSDKSLDEHLAFWDRYYSYGSNTVVNTVNEVVENLTRMLPMLVVPASAPAWVGITAQTAYFTSMAGNSFDNYLKIMGDKADFMSGVFYTAAMTGIEFATEHLVGDKIFGKGLLNTNKILANISSNTARVLASLGLTFVSEGLEESLAEILDGALNEKMLGDNLKEHTTLRDVINAGIIGGIIGIIGEGIGVAKTEKIEGLTKFNSMIYKELFSEASQKANLTRNLSQLRAYYNNESLSTIAKEHTEEFKAAFNADMKLDESLVKSFLTLSTFANNIGMDNFTKAEELLKNTLERKANMARGQLLYNDIIKDEKGKLRIDKEYKESEKLAAENFNKYVSKDTNFIVKQEELTDTEFKIKQGLAKLFPNFNVVFGQVVGNNNQNWKGSTIGGKMIYVDSEYVKNHSANDIFNQMINHEMVHDLQRNGLILTHKTMDDLDKIMNRLGFNINYDTIQYDDSMFLDKTVEERKLLTRAEKQAIFYSQQLLFNKELIKAILTGDDKVFADVYRWARKKSNNIATSSQKGILLYNSLNTVLELYRECIIEETANDKTTKTLIDKVGEEFFTEYQVEHIYASYQNDKIDNHMLLIGKEMDFATASKLKVLRDLYSYVKPNLKTGFFVFDRIFDISYYDENSELIQSFNATKSDEDSKIQFKDMISDILDSQNLYYDERFGKLIETTPLNESIKSDFKNDLFKYYELRENKINEHIGDMSNDVSYLRSEDLREIENKIAKNYRFLSDVYDLSKLPKECQKLKDIRLLYTYREDAVFGEWHSDAEYIVINFNSDYSKGIENMFPSFIHTLIHETTHAVADYTDLFRGSSQAEISEALREMDEESFDELAEKIYYIDPATLDKLESEYPESDVYEEIAYYLYHLEGGEFNAELFKDSKIGNRELKYGIYETDNFFYIDRYTGRLVGVGDWSFLNKYNLKFNENRPITSDESNKKDARRKYTENEKEKLRTVQAIRNTIKNNIEDIQIDKNTLPEKQKMVSELLGEKVTKYIDKNFDNKSEKNALYQYIADSEELINYFKDISTKELETERTDRALNESLPMEVKDKSGEYKEIVIEDTKSNVEESIEERNVKNIKLAIENKILTRYILNEIKTGNGKPSEKKLYNFYTEIEDDSNKYTQKQLDYITKACNAISEKNGWDKFDKIEKTQASTLEETSDVELKKAIYDLYDLNSDETALSKIERLKQVNFKTQERFKDATKDDLKRLYSLRDEIITELNVKKEKIEDKSNVVKSIKYYSEQLKKSSSEDVKKYITDKVIDKDLSKTYTIEELKEIRDKLKEFKNTILTEAKEELKNVSRETKKKESSRTSVRKTEKTTDSKKLTKDIIKDVQLEKNISDDTRKKAQSLTKLDIENSDVNKIIDSNKAVSNIKEASERTKKIAEKISTIKYSEKYTKSTSKGIAEDSYLQSLSQYEFEEQCDAVLKELDDGELLPLVKELGANYNLFNLEQRTNIDRAIVYINLSLIGDTQTKLKTTAEERSQFQDFFAAYARGAGYTFQEMSQNYKNSTPVKTVLEEFSKTWDTDVTKLSKEDVEIILGTSLETLQDKYEKLLPEVQQEEKDAIESNNDETIDRARERLSVVEDTLDAIKKGDYLKLLEIQYRNLRDSIISTDAQGEAKFVSELTKKLRDEYKKITKEGFKQMTPRQKQAYIGKFASKLKNYRFFSMLSNPSTWVNNYISNNVMRFTDFLTRKIETSIEERLQAKGDKTTQLRYFTKEEISDEVNEFVTDMDDIINKACGGNRYTSSVFSTKDNKIKLDKEPVFKNKILHWYEELVNTALDAGDKKFVKNAIVINLKQILQANMNFIYDGVLQHAQLIYKADSKEELENKLKSSDKDIDKKYYDAIFNDNKSQLLRLMPEGTRDVLLNSAFSRAYQTYFRNTNKVVKLLENLNQNHPWFGLITSVIMPFPKVATNIMTTMFRYSPFEWINVIKDYVNLKNVNKSGMILDMEQYFAKAKLGRSMSQAIIGTTNVFIGAILAAIGKSIGFGLGKDKDDDYALLLGDISIKLSRFDGVSGALAIGAMLEKICEGKANLITDFTKILYDYTLLSNLNDMIIYNRDALGYAENLAMNWANQYIPSVVRSVAKIVDPYDKKKSTNFFVKFAENVGQNIPGFSKFIPNKIDPYTSLPISRTRSNLGNIGDNALQIAYSLIIPFQVNMPSAVEKEANKIGATTTGLGSYFTFNGKKYIINESDYTKYSIVRAQFVNSEITKLMNSSSYKRMNDKDKKNAIEKIYRQATELAKTKYWTDKGNIRVFTTIDSYNIYKNYLNQQKNIRKIFSGYKGSQYITKK